MGAVVWFTGLPAAGKTTVASLLVAELAERGIDVVHLDGDVVRAALTSDLGFTKEDRDANVVRVAVAAATVAASDGIAVVSLISPYAGARAQARSLAEAVGGFVEIYVATPVGECVRRDPKGMYARAFAGELNDFTGVSAPYEPPEAPELRLDTTAVDPSETRDAVLALLERLDVV